MNIVSMILLMSAMAQTEGQANYIDLEENTLVCRSRMAAEQWSDASAQNDQNVLGWLSNSACSRLDHGYRRQVVVAREAQFSEVRVTNGRWKRNLFVMHTDDEREGATGQD